jgi:hypothetical protein
MAKQAKVAFELNDEDAGVIEDANGSRTVLIREFDINKMHPYDETDLKSACKIVVIGKPKTGKSTLIENIMLYKSHICPTIQIYSGSEAENGFYKRIAPDVTIFSKMDVKAQENFLKRQKIARQYLPNPWAMQINDDVTDDPSILRKPLFQGIYKRGRHFNMIHILALQYPMDISPGLRSCVDYVFILATAIQADRKKLYENFASGSIPSFQDFCDIMDVITEDHTALVIDNFTESNKIEDRVFYFKADPTKVPDGWKFGSKDCWDFHNQRMDPDYTPSIL